MIEAVSYQFLINGAPSERQLSWNAWDSLGNAAVHRLFT